MHQTHQSPRQLAHVIQKTRKDFEEDKTSADNKLVLAERLEIRQ